jgi:hypothetical protein
LGTAAHKYKNVVFQIGAPSAKPRGAANTSHGVNHRNDSAWCGTMNDMKVRENSRGRRHICKRSVA